MKTFPLSFAHCVTPPKHGTHSHFESGDCASLRRRSPKPRGAHFGNSQMEVPKGPLKIARRFNAGYQATPGQVPKGRLKEAAGKSAQSSLRDADGIDGIPGVETPGYCRGVPPAARLPAAWPGWRLIQRSLRSPRVRS